MNSELRVNEFTFIDLFAGIGGFRLAFEALGGKCVFTSEWNAKARETYSANFSIDHPIAGDIREVSADQVPPHNVLLAGFPCQPFSIAGVSKKNSLGRAHGFECEDQGNLFFEIVRMLRHHKPQAFLLENVKNLLSHDKRNTFRVISERLADIGYYVDTRIVDAQAFVPQHRERIFIAGFRKETGFDFAQMPLPPKVAWPRLSSILHSEDGTEDPEPPYTNGPKAAVDRRYILTENLWNYLRGYAAKHKAKGNGFGFGLVGPEDVTRTLSARYYKDGSEILIRRGRGRPRRLTPRECSRLMGFERPGKKFVIPVSDTQAYKQFGNAVVPPVVRAVGAFMLPHILSIIHDKPLLASVPRKPVQGALPFVAV